MRHLLLAFLLCLTVTLSAQDERIKHFSVDIQTRQDASLDITETITFVAAGDEIKRGLTRALHKDPLDYTGYMASFEYSVQSVTRDGQKEPFSLKSSNGLPTIYIGDKDVFLDPGTYTYVIKYRAKNQVYGLDKIDEIRWPLEGSTGKLPVDEADITIRFDRDIRIIQSACYTGAFGSTAEDCEFSQDGSVVTFVATKPLKPGEGMTVATSISAGYFNRPVPPPPPTPLEKKGVLYTIVIGLASILGYAYSMWRKYGVDPVGEKVKPEFYPPAELSPASVAYLGSSFSGQHQVTASITALSIAGYLEITEKKQKKLFGETEIFTVSLTDKVPAQGGLSDEQRAIYDGVVAEGGLELNGEYNEAIGEITVDHQKSLEKEHKEFRKDGRSSKGILPMLGMIIVMLSIGGYFLNVSGGLGTVAFLIGIVVSLITFGVYAWLIQQPSLDKVVLKNKIAGLKEYLSLSEKKRAALPGAPEMTQDYFQMLLPYAIAFGIDNNWASDLAADWAATGSRPGENYMMAAPFMVAGFGNRFGSNYASTSINPAASGGGGGGFSSGGGSVGGGGGTGGW